jgi:glutamine---fructose-6-phosphate transaminase (isomerizing)
MNSIEIMTHEIESQRNLLTSLQLPIPRKPESCIFVGSGDSHVSGLLSTYVSGFRSLSLKPLDIITFPKIAKGHEVFFVSISGNTSTNIRAAKVMKTHNIKTTAITTDSNSPLARICKDVIKINIPVATQPTAGTLTFSASAIICLGLVTDIANTALIPSIYRECEKKFHELDDISFKKSVYVFLGNEFLYPCAVYGKLKINEIFGFHSNAYCIDEFFHAPIFGVQRTDCLLMLEKNKIKQNSHENMFRKMLSKVGLTVISIKCGYKSTFRSIMSSIFIQQMIFATQAQRMGLRDCFFVKNKQFLSLSSNMIYNINL